MAFDVRLKCLVDDKIALNSPSASRSPEAFLPLALSTVFTLFDDLTQ